MKTLNQQDMIFDIIEQLITFLKNPIDEIKNPPDWDWKTLILVQASLAGLSGVLFGLFGRNWVEVMVGLLLFPIINVLVSVFIFGFLYYIFSTFQQTQVEIKALYTLIILANLPFYILHPVSAFLPPLDLILFAFTGILLIVGLTENFTVDKKFVIKVIAVLYALFFLAWITNRIQSTTDEKSLKNKFSLISTEQKVENKTS